MGSGRRCWVTQGERVGSLHCFVGVQDGACHGRATKDTKKQHEKPERRRLRVRKDVTYACATEIMLISACPKHASFFCENKAQEKYKTVQATVPRAKQQTRTDIGERPTRQARRESFRSARFGPNT